MTRHLRLLTALFAVLTGCSEPPPAHTRRPESTENENLRKPAADRSAPAVDLRLSIVADTPMAEVTLIGGTQPIGVMDDPAFYSFDVRSSGGIEIPPHVYHRSVQVTSRPVILKRGTLLNHQFNLRCGPLGHRYPDGQCDWRYDFDRGTRYTISVRFQGVLPASSDSEKPWNLREIVSNRAELMVP